MRKTIASLYVTATLALALNPSNVPAGQTYELRSRRAAEAIDRVETTVEVGGDLKVIEADQPQRLPINLSARLTYHEKTLEVSSVAGGTTRSLRAYSAPDVSLQVGNQDFSPALRDDRRLIVAEAGAESTAMFSPLGPLTRDELDLIDQPGNTLLLDRLLPDGQVAVGDTWKHSPELIATLLGIDAVKSTDVTSKLLEVVGDIARIDLAGDVSGAVGGVATEIDVTGRYQFNLTTGRIAWFGLLLKEERAVGHIGPGVDWTAKLQMTIQPGGSSPELVAAALGGLPLEATPGSTLLVYDSPDGGWQFLHDRQWFTVSDTGKIAILQRVDRGELVAQCKISTLEGTQSDITIGRFQNDIQRGLDKSFKRFVSASQRTNSAGYQEYNVVVEGSVPITLDKQEQELPIHWIYYLLSDGQGRRLVVAFVVEASLLERFGGADRELLDSLRLRGSEMASRPATATSQR